MKVIEAIGAVDSQKPNSYSQTDKIGWLSQLDGVIKLEIINTHEGGDNIAFRGYTESDLEKELLVSAPYDALYIKWLESKIDYANGEYGKYNNSTQAFNSAFADFERYYHRTHKSVKKNFKYF